MLDLVEKRNRGFVFSGVQAVVSSEQKVRVSFAKLLRRPFASRSDSHFLPTLTTALIERQRDLRSGWVFTTLPMFMATRMKMLARFYLPHCFPAACCQILDDIGVAVLLRIIVGVVHGLCIARRRPLRRRGRCSRRRAARRCPVLAPWRPAFPRCKVRRPPAVLNRRPVIRTRG